MSVKHFDAIIVGAGIVGLTQAIALAARHWNVALIDSKPISVNKNDDFDSRVYAINRSTKKFWEQLQVWPKLSRLTPYKSMQVWDALGGGELQFHAHEIAKWELGHIIEESVIKSALLEILNQQHHIHCFPEEMLTSLEFEKSRVRVSGSSEFDTPLLIGADGANSWVRQQAGIELTQQNCEQTAFVCTVTTEQPHENCARQAFLSTGPVALLPLQEPHKTSLVWSVDTGEAEKIAALNDPDFADALTEIFKEKFSRITEVTARLAFPLVQRQAKQFVRQNLALIGDAAHTLHPLAGLGMNLGLTDVEVLINTLQSPQRITLTQLQRYEAQQIGQSASLISALKTLQQLFAGENPAKASIRSLGLNLTNRIPPLKRFLMEQAALA